MKPFHFLTVAATSAALGLLVMPTAVLAQDQHALEARIAQLEAQLTALKTEVQSATAAQIVQAEDIIRIQQAPPPAPPAPAVTPTDGFRIGNNMLKFGGFIKADYNLSAYSAGDPANGDLLREFYIPGAVPVGGLDEGMASDFNARQTRFWLTSEGTAGGRRVGARIEMDFQALPGTGDQRTTSPSNLSLRRAFVTIDNWLFGQEWTNFQNMSALPETAEYIGLAEGTVFVRQVQARYTNGPFSISVENPETTVTPFRTAARVVADDNTVPDVTARYTLARPWGEVSVSGLARQLSYETTGAAAIDSDTLGYGVSLAAKIKFGSKDDLRMMLTAGEGIGRYVGLNLANDAVLNAAGDLEAISLIAAYGSFRHVWSPQWRSNAGYSFQSIDNDRALSALTTNRSATSGRVNLIYTPVAGLDLGGEVGFGRRELENGIDGDMRRLTLFAKYSF